MRRRPALLLAVVLGVVLAGLFALRVWPGCQEPEWTNVRSVPGAGEYEGTLEAPLDNRVSGRLAERSLRVVEARLERLPAGVTWEQHLAFRDANADGMDRQIERVPEPDAPVSYAEWSGCGRTLFVVGTSETDGRLVVETVLAGAR